MVQGRVMVGGLLVLLGTADVGLISFELAPRLAASRRAGQEAVAPSDDAVDMGRRFGAVGPVRESGDVGEEDEIPLTAARPSDLPVHLGVDADARTPVDVKDPVAVVTEVEAGNTVDAKDSKAVGSALDGGAELERAEPRSRGAKLAQVPDLLFDRDEVELDERTMAAVDQVAVALKARPGLRVVVRGHSCSLGSSAYNLEISRQRASLVQRRLLEQGVAADRISIEAVGEREPVAARRRAQRLVRSRRVEILWRQ